MLKKNIDATGRWARAITAGLLFVATGVSFFLAAPWWLTLFLLAAALFTAFEAAMSWCVVRACGIQTKI